MTKLTFGRVNLNRRATGSALVSALAISSGVQAEQISDQVVQSNVEAIHVTAEREGLLKGQDTTTSKMSLSLKDTGRSITQLDDQALQDRAITNVREAFDYVAGFRANGPADRTYTARGIRTSIDNVMVDGMRSLQGGEGGTGSRLPSTFNAESTTFLRGPAGLINGSGVGGGIVNITSKQPQELSETTLGISTRSYMSDDTGYMKQNSAALSVDSTGAIGNSDVLYRVIGEYTPAGEHFQKGRKIDEKQLDAALTFKIGEKTKITPRLQISNRDKTGGSGYADGVFEEGFFSGSVSTYGEPVNRGKYYGSPDDKGENDTKSMSLRIDHEINDNWTMRVQGRKSETNSLSQDLYISDSSALQNALGKDEVNRKWVFSKGEDKYSLLDLVTEGKFQFAGLDHHLAAGVNYRDMDVNFERNFQDSADAFSKNPISASNPDNQSVGAIPASLLEIEYSPKTQKDTNIYIKDRVSFGKLTVAAGIAYVKQENSSKSGSDSYSGTQSDTIWDLGAVYALTPDLNVFASYSRAYEPVSSRYIAQYGQGKTDYVPVEGHNYETGVKGSFLNGKLDAAVTLFQLERKNNTEFVRNSSGWLIEQSSGVGFRSKGVEIDAKMDFTPRISSQLSYAFTRASNTSGDDKGRQAKNTPKHSIALWNSYQLSGELAPVRLGLGLRYEGQRYDGKNTIKAYTEMDLGAYYETPKWDASMVVRNAFDKNRAEAGANWVTVQPNEPRSLNLTFKYRL